jgi:surface protein
MEYMFDGCSKLETLNLGGTFNTAKITSMIYVFADCSSLKTLDLSSFNTEKVQYMNNMFSGCSSLTSIDLSSFNTSIVRNMKSMFSGCAKLNTLDLTSFKFWNKANLPTTTNMLNGLNSEGEIYDLYVTQAGYDFLTGKADYGTGNFTLKVK